MINAETDWELVKNAVRYEDTLKKHLNNINKEIIEASTNGKNSINYTVWKLSSNSFIKWFNWNFMYWQKLSCLMFWHIREEWDIDNFLVDGE